MLPPKPAVLMDGTALLLLCLLTRIPAESSIRGFTSISLAMALDASKYEVLSRCLSAASGAVPGDQPDSLYLVNEENGELLELLTAGGTKVDEDIIAGDVKTNTAAAYLYDNDHEV